MIRKSNFAILLLFAGILRLSPSTNAADAETDWQAVIALDAGPEKPPSEEGAREAVLRHLIKQDQALRIFLNEQPSDARAFEARLRLARLLQIRGDFEQSPKLRTEGERLLDSLDKSATPEQRVEVDFAKVTRLMRNLREVTPNQREELLFATRKFQIAHPTDRRLALLLTEVATLFDSQPKIKESLLADAQPLATNPDLQGRIADDLKRVRFLRKEVPLVFPTSPNPAIKPADFRGRPLILIFFATPSPPSLAAIPLLQRTLTQLPPGSVRVLGVSLDDQRHTLDAVIKSRAITWPVLFDGLGWESPLVRTLGINALPTVWLLDQRGHLRSLNALENTQAKVRELLQER